MNETKKNRLTFDERLKIEDFLKNSSLSLFEIGKEINRSYAVVNYEIKKNGGPLNYTAIDAQKRAEETAINATKKAREGKIYFITYEDRKKIEELIYSGLSVREIASQLNLNLNAVYREVRRGGGRFLYKADNVSAFEKKSIFIETKKSYEIFKSEINSLSTKFEEILINIKNFETQFTEFKNKWSN